MPIWWPVGQLVSVLVCSSVGRTFVGHFDFFLYIIFIGNLDYETYLDHNIIYFIMCNKSSLHAPFVFHASFACGFHFVFFSTCFVTLGSPGCKQASFHLIFTTASVSVCLTNSTTFLWHHIYVGSHLSLVYSHSMLIPHGNDFNLVPSNIFQLNYCISLH